MSPNDRWSPYPDSMVDVRMREATTDDLWVRMGVVTRDEINRSAWPSPPGYDAAHYCRYCFADMRLASGSCTRAPAIDEYTLGEHAS